MAENKSREAGKEQGVCWAAYCTKCGANHGDKYGMHVCPFCAGKVDVLCQPPKTASQGEGIQLKL